MAGKIQSLKTNIKKPALKPLSDNGISVHSKTLKRWYQLIHLGRALDTKAATYVRQGKGWSYQSSCAGHEGIQLILGLSFRPGKDFLFSYYRDLLTCLAAGLTLDELIRNGLSRATDVGSGGRHMSNHFSKPSIRIQNVSSATGNHSLHATGVARAIKKYRGDEIAFASFGDSSVSEGFVYEAISGAAREAVPVIFVIQNNRYGISVPLREGAANQCVADNFTGFQSVKIERVDGTNVFDSWRGCRSPSTTSNPARVRRSCTPTASVCFHTAIPTSRSCTGTSRKLTRHAGQTRWHAFAPTFSKTKSLPRRRLPALKMKI